MKIYRLQSNLRYFLATAALLCVASVTTYSLLGDERNGKNTERPAPNRTDEKEAASAAPTETGATAHEVESAGLSGHLREMTYKQIRAIARGGELPAAIVQKFGSAPEGMNEALLRELTRRWDRQSGGQAEAQSVTEPQVREAAAPKPETDQPAVDRRTEPAAVKLDRVEVDAVSGEPANVAVMEVTFVEGHGPIVYPDQQLHLKSSGRRAHYVTFDVSYQQQDDGSPYRVDQIRVAFLVRGEEPVKLWLSGIERFELEQQEITLQEAPERHRQLLNQWWKSFATVPKDLDFEQQMLKESLLDILARRLKLPGPWPKVTAKVSDETFSLERQFERAVGMLFGIESVKLAMQEDATLNRSTRHEKANQPLPDRPPVRSVSIPDFPSSTWIEPIAMHVPAECFYLRTGNLANYRYFREFLLGWGGSLDDIVATRSLSHPTRRRIETQLGLNPEQVSDAEFDKLVSDMALVGCDPLFTNGAAVGLVFEARNARGLYDLIKAQRNEASQRVPNASERRVNVGQRAVSLLASDDNRIRSFYAIDGDYHLVTNSRDLLERFFEAGAGDRSLGSLREFRYARSKTHDRRQTLAFLYLSDPFFQNLISPQFRIELTRRRQAADELQQLQMAELVARAERIDADTIDGLIEARLLPTDFGIRPDGSRPKLSDGRTVDSLRGAPGTFLPVFDVPLQKATRSEISSYNSFLRTYNDQWRRIDPVTVVFSREGSSAGGLQRVGLDIIITPYARQKYAILQRHLAPGSSRRVAPVEGDLLSVDTAVRTSLGRPSHLLYLGLRDDTVPFAFNNGQVELVDQPNGASFAKTRSYAAISPPSTDVLRLLASVLDPNRSSTPPQPTQPPHTSRAPPPLMMPTVGRALFYFGWAFGNMTTRMGEIARYTSLVDTRNSWSVVSTNDKIRRRTHDHLFEEQIPKSTQVRMRMGSLSGSKVEPYIQAYTYLASRRVSGENARFLNEFGDWMQLPPGKARAEAERLLGAEIQCALGGEFELREIDGHQRWVSTSWSNASRFKVEKTPESWRFPFLDWARGLNLTFDLDANTLRARVDLLIRPENDHVGPPSGMQMVNLAPITTDSNVRQAVFKISPTVNGTANRGQADNSVRPSSVPATRLPQGQPTARQTRNARSSGDWILGVRVSTGQESIRVKHVHADSPAERVGIRVGDILGSVDGRAPVNLDQLVNLLEWAQNRGTVTVQVIRNGSPVTFEVPLRRR